MALRITLKGETRIPGGLPPLFRDIMRTVLEAEGLPKDSEVSLLLCDNPTITGLNRRFRQVAGPTDVLSFPQYTNREEIPDRRRGVLLGDIVISLERARSQARDYGHSLKRELGFLFLHGLLHLLGYHHDSPREEREMRRREEAILKSMGLRREENAGPKF